MPRGRAPGRPLTDLELRHLRLLLEIRERTKGATRTYDERLEDEVLACREAGASVRGIAEAIGVGPSTIQTWTKHARRRKGSS